MVTGAVVAWPGMVTVQPTSIKSGSTRCLPTGRIVALDRLKDLAVAVGGAELAESDLGQHVAGLGFALVLPALLTVGLPGVGDEQLPGQSWVSPPSTASSMPVV